MKKAVVIFISIITLFPLLKAQSDIDAFRFSQVNREGSARFMGAGGALGAVGADFSALSVNPAAIAIFKRHEISITPLSISIFKTKSDFNGTSLTTPRVRYVFPQVGLVMKVPLSTNHWEGLYFGFGFNRIQDFNGRFNIEGRSKGHSMADEFALNATNDNMDFGAASDFYGVSHFAYDAYLIDPDPAGSNTHRKYISAISGLNLRQNRFVEMRGGIDEMNFTIGANYSDKFFMGVSAGIPFLSYTETSTYVEEDDKNETSVINHFKFDDKLSVTGVGINMKLGVIYQPVSFMRLGLSFQTPSYYSSLSEKFDRSMYAENDTGKQLKASYFSEYKYTLTTPLRASFSMAFLINKRGFISLEYEISDFSQANMIASDYTFNEENRLIQAKYGLAHIFRIGGEINVSEHFLLRAGYNYLSSPYKKRINDGSAHVASAGMGFRLNRFFFDLAYSLRLSKEKYWIYNADLVDAAGMDLARHKIYATLGMKF
jgi:long-subunit fatty acid transport protein